MKKAFALMLAIVLFTVCVAGCTHSPETPVADDPNALVVMGKSTDMEKSYIKKIFDRYRSETGKSLRVVEIDDDRFEDEASRLFAAGNGPDVFFHFNNDDLNRFNVASDFCYFDDEPWVDELTQSAKSYCTSADGHILGLPFWESSVSGCYYNKKLLGMFDAATNQKNFDVLCREILDGYNGTVAPICWAADGCSWMFQFALDPVFADEPNGPELLRKLNADEIGYADIPEVRKMLVWIDNAAKSGWFGKDYLSTDWNKIGEDLSSGAAAMTFIWDTWFYTDFKPGKYTKEDFALMPVFMGTADGGTYEGGNLNMMMVNSHSERLADAKAFVEFCATADHYNYAFDGVSTVSCFKGQTTNIQSHMVTDPETAESIREKERVSTASTKIAGYSADDFTAAVNKLLRGETDIDGCIALLDEYRLSRKQGR